MSEYRMRQTQMAAKSSFTPIASGLLQRACACGQHTAGSSGECEECKQKREGMLQRAAVNRASVVGVPAIVREALRLPGQELDAATRAFMEPRFGYDFSGVRVHTDGKAAESAEALNALAYTVGRDVVFGNDRGQVRNGFAKWSGSENVVLQRQTDDQGPFNGTVALGMTNTQNIRYRCGTILGCPLIEHCDDRVCAVADCGRGTCPGCPPGLGNIIWRAWCSYRCVPSGSAFSFFTTIGNAKVGPFCLD